MSTFRAGLIVTIVAAIFATTALTAFGHIYAAYDLGDIIERVILWLPLTLAASAPIGLVVFPFMHRVIGGGHSLKPRSFALVGALVGVTLAGYAVWRFRAVLMSASFVALPLFVVIGAVTGFLSGYLFEALVRVRGEEAPTAQDAP